jgi:tetratricopeptide (TPR) repeat protein
MASQAAESQATGVREADAACAQCHATIFQNYLSTPMAQASGLAADRLHSGRFLHARSGVEYTVGPRHAEGVLSYRSLTAPGMSGEWPLTYFLGSGHLGTTYLYSIGSYLFESPVAWYAPSQTYDMKPGLDELDHLPPPLPMQSSCLRCHMSSVQASDPGTLNRFKGLPFLHTGITCEACHGDGTEHVTTRGKGKIVNPAKLKTELRDSICISCHLEGDVSVERNGHSVLNYRPGQSISEYMAYYVHAGSALTDRGVSEVEQLSQSTCKQISGDRMSCMSCHDPHYTPDAAHKAAFFRGKCLACHNQPEFVSTHHPENQDCTSCHMPRNGAINILHVAWTDHRLLKRPPDAKPASGAREGGALTPIFSPTATPRDLAMANYQALLDGDQSVESVTWQQLLAQRDQIADDRDALNALGNLGAERGEFSVAEQAFRRVLQLDPHNLTALSNLGTLVAKQGKLHESLVLLKTAFTENQDVPGLAMNLAKVQCLAGDGAAARSTLKAALVYCPSLEDMRRLLSQMNACDGTDAK